jgi:hypothetical protein
MTDLNEIEKDISRLKKVLIHQIKNSTWKHSFQGHYENELFEIKKSKYKIWYIYTIDDRGKHDTEIEITHLFNHLEFFFYLYFYIKPKCNQYEKFKQKENLSRASKRFLEMNKKEGRNSKLKELFEHI